MPGKPSIESYTTPPGVAPSLPEVAVVQNMPWYKSTTFWGIVIPIALQVLSGLFKWNPGLSTEDVTALAQGVANIASVVGGLVALRGRSNAVSGGVARAIYFTSPKR